MSTLREKRVFFVVGRNIFNNTNQFSKTAQQSPQKEVASAASSDVMGLLVKQQIVIPANAGIFSKFLKFPAFAGMTPAESKIKQGARA